MFDVYKQANLTKTFSTTTMVDIRLGLRSVYMFTKCTVMLTLPFQIKLNNYLTPASKHNGVGSGTPDPNKGSFLKNYCLKLNKRK